MMITIMIIIIIIMTIMIRIFNNDDNDDNNNNNNMTPSYAIIPSVFAGLVAEQSSARNSEI